MPKLYRIILPVNDLDAAQAFYSSLFGDEGRRVSPERHYFDCEGTILACYDPLMFNEKAEMVPNPEHIYFAVDDLSAMLARCRAAGATIEGGIEKRPWGETSFYVTDPFGNPLCFVVRGTEFRGDEG